MRFKYFVIFFFFFQFLFEIFKYLYWYTFSENIYVETLLCFANLNLRYLFVFFLALEYKKPHQIEICLHHATETCVIANLKMARS